VSWDPRALPSQAGRTFVVTGGNAGLGYFTAEQLAGAGARVVIAARSAERTAVAIDSIREHVSDADVSHLPFDLTSLAAIREAASRIRDLGPIAGLANNAGLVVAPRKRQETADGFELIVGGNFLGHFALTALIFSSLAPNGRVVGMGSDSTRMVRLDPDDLYSERRYAPFRAYAFSKHALHGFAFELDRRLRAVDDGRASLLAHPGYATSAYASKRPGITGREPGILRFGEAATGWVGQGKDHGAWPMVRALTDPDAESGQFYGPSRLLAGPPVLQTPVRSSASAAFGAHLWADAQERTGIHFPL
jgi:NAD(P)-dependent dehydrogenase (short-subunit alcohol dehydrogenase family)